MKKMLHILLALIVSLTFAACGGGQEEAEPGDEMDTGEVITIPAEEIDFTQADLPQPSVAWSDTTAVNGDYCCVCQTQSGQQSIQLTGVGSAFDVCVGCEIACRNAGHQGADGSRSRGGACP